MERIKSYLSYVFGLALLIVSALLFKQKRQTENAQAQLANEKSKEAMKEIDHAIEDQAKKSSDAVSRFRDLDRQ